MLSQVSNERESLQFCNSEHVTNVMAEVVFSCPENNSQASEYICGEDDCHCHLAAERAIWLWCIFLAFAFPNLGAFLRSLRIWLFKLQKIPTLKSFLFVTMMEVLHTVGIVLMVTLVLPNVDTLKGMTLSCGVYIIPSILLIFSRKQRNEGKVSWTWQYLFFDVVALLAQLAPIVFWTVFPSDGKHNWILPISLLLISCAWWESNVGENFGLEWMWQIKKEMLEKKRYFCYLIIAPLKTVIFFCLMLLITALNYTGSHRFTDIFFDFRALGNHSYKVQEVQETSTNEFEEANRDKTS